MDDHDTITRRALAALKGWLDDKTAESPYDLSLLERKLLSVTTVLAVDPAIYLFDEPMMSLDWEKPAQVPDRNFPQLAGSGPQVVTITHDMDWVARREFEVGVCYGTRKVWLRRQSTELNNQSRTCPAEWDYYHRGLWT